VALNKIDSVVKVMEGAAEAFVERSADLVMANIHFPVIEELIKKRVFSEGETILVSGLLRSQVNAVLDLISHRNLTLLNKWEEDMTWYTIAARWERRKES
jgi:ribosomal protein L11 methylase PrmA